MTLLLIELLELREAFELMLLYSLNSFVVFGLLVFEEIKYFRGLNMNLLLLGGCFMRFVIPSITKAIGAIGDEEYAFLLPENVVNDYMFPAAVWMNIYYSLFFWCFVRFESKHTIEEAIRPFFQRMNVAWVSIPLFVVGIVYNIVTSFVPAGIIPGFVETIFGRMSTLAILIQLFNALFRPTRFNKVIFTMFIVASVWESMFFGFYKEAIMMNFVFYLLYYFLECEYNHKKIVTPKLVISGIALLLFVDLIIYPFMTTKRIVAGWDDTMGLPANNYSNIDILVDVIVGKSLSERGENTASGRLDALIPNAFFYKECCTKGLRTTMLAKSNIELLVPRFLNKNKHGNESGHMVYAYAMTGSFANYDMALSNNFTGQFSSAYLLGGWMFVFILAVANGFFLMFYYNFLLKHINNILAIVFLIPLVLSAILAFEEISDGGVLRMGYNTAQMLLVLIITTVFPRFLRIKYIAKK